MLKRLVLALALSTALVSAGVGPAQAGPALAAVAAFAATPLGGFIVDIGVTLVTSAVGNLIKQLVSPKNASTSAAVNGIRGSVAGGDDVPIGFILGDRATAGSLAYHGRWGELDGTPNAYHVEERILSDVPIPHKPGVWVDTQKVTVDWAAEPVAQGYPILELRFAGRDYGWARYYDGTQTTADAYLLDKFGAHETRPYLDDMIGRGQAKVITTFLVNRDLFKQVPKLLFVSDGIPLYDISRDSTAGGSGAHRINDPATWEPSNILPVQIFNILRGIYYGDEWIWGMQDTPVTRLPASSWIAAINEARTSTLKADGSHEPQFAGGYEVTCDMEPQAVIKELLKGCVGRAAEIGGVYKMVCGVPASSVFSFTDRDVLVTKELGFDPWPTLDNTVNAIQGSYPEPALAWAYKDAPPRYSAEFEAADLGKRLPKAARYEVVNSATQVQRLTAAALDDARRFRRHSLFLPPEASELEPLDTVSWTSAGAGYTSKKFLIGVVDDYPTYIDYFELQEIDPGDFDYTAADDELPFTVGELSSSPTPAQAVADWAVAPSSVRDSDGIGRAPSIRMFWDGSQPDVRALLYEVRLDADDSAVIAGEFASGFALGVGNTPAGAVLPVEAYEARGKYDPFSSRPTAWSAWLPVTTPDIRISAGALDAHLNAAVQQLVENIPSDLLVMREEIGRLAGTLGDQVTVLREALGQINIGVGARYEENQAGIEQALTAIADANESFATYVLSASALFDRYSGDGLLRVLVGATPAGATSAIDLTSTAGDGGAVATAALRIAAYIDGLLGTYSEVRILGDHVVITDDDDDPTAGLDGTYIKHLTVTSLAFVEGSILNPQVASFSGISLRTDALASGDQASAWMDLVSFTIDATDGLTEQCLFNLGINQVVNTTTVSGASVSVEMQLLRNGTLIDGPRNIQPGAIVPIISWTGIFTDTPPAASTYTYLFQCRVHKSAGSSANCQWAVGVGRGWVFQPKSGV